MLFCFNHVDIKMTGNSGRDVWLTLSYMFFDRLKKYSKLLFLEKLYFKVYVYACVCSCEYRCLWNSENSICTYRVELTSGCEPCNVGAEN